MIDQDSNFKIKTELRELRDFCFKNVIPNHVSYYFCETKDKIGEASCELYNGSYEINTCDLDYWFASHTFSAEHLVSFTVASSHEPIHILQDFYKNSKDDYSRTVFEDKIANAMWDNFRKTNYPNQLYEIEARKHSYKNAFKNFSQFFNLDNRGKTWLSAQLVEHMINYELDEKLNDIDIERLYDSHYNENMSLIRNYYDSKIIEWGNSLYKIPNTRFDGKLSNLINFEFSSKTEQLFSIIETTLDPNNKILVKSDIRQLIENSFIPDVLEKRKISKEPQPLD